VYKFNLEIRYIDCITKLLIDDKVEPEEICTVATYLNVCGDEAYYEQYQLRSFWAIYLVLTNTSNNYIKLNHLSGRMFNETKYRELFVSDKGSNEKIYFPEMKLSPNQSVIVPIISSLPKFESGYQYIECSHTYMMILEDDQSQSLSHFRSDADSYKLYAIGTAIWPYQIEYTIDEMSYLQAIHELDFTNLYMIDRFWECGSCPYLFFFNDQNNTIRYFSEIFAKEPIVLQTYEIIIPIGYNKVFIAELENEITYVKNIYINNTIKTMNRLLLKDSTIVINVREGQKLIINGFYIPFRNYKKQNPFHKNELIKHFMFEKSYCYTNDQFSRIPINSLKKNIRSYNRASKL